MIYNSYSQDYVDMLRKEIERQQKIISKKDLINFYMSLALFLLSIFTMWGWLILFNNAERL